MTTYYIACDLGAESGRVIEGALNNGRLVLSELHRFPNQPIKDKDSLYWDIPQLFQEVLIGLHKVGQREDPIEKTWSAKLIQSLRLPSKLFPPIVPSGTLIGPLRPDVAEQTKLEDVKVVA